MAFNEKMADRVRDIISETHKISEEKKMFGGLCFMVNDKMCVGVESDRLMIRFDPEKNDDLMEKEGVMPMDFTGRVMKGYLFVDTFKNFLSRMVFPHECQYPIPMIPPLCSIISCLRKNTRLEFKC